MHRTIESGDRGKASVRRGVGQTVDRPPEAGGARSPKAKNNSVAPQMNWADFAHSLYVRFQDDEVPAMGAQLTYYLILAFFPFLIFVIACLSFTNLTADDAISFSRMYFRTSQTRRYRRRSSRSSSPKAARSYRSG